MNYHAAGRRCALNGNISEHCRRCSKVIGEAAHYWDSPYWYCVPCGAVVIAEQTLQALA